MMVLWAFLAVVLYLAAGWVLLILYGKRKYDEGKFASQLRYLARIDAMQADLDRLRPRLMALPPPPASPASHIPGRAGPPPMTPPARPVTLRRPQPRNDPTPDTGAMTALTTGGMRALTDDLVARIEAGTFPPLPDGLS